MSESEQQHQHQHQHPQPHGHRHPVYDRDYWEDRYGQPGRAWSGRPNAALVDEATALTPGRALDVGSGEGGDALWLAARGWQVTGVDISQNALDKAAAVAREREDVDPARVTWQQADLTGWSRSRIAGDCSPHWPTAWHRAARC
jgi:SAM-dependent methyltransferase